MPEEVLASQESATECVGAAIPAPLKASVVVEGWALLVKVRVLDAEPVTAGLKVTVKLTLCPDGMVSGNERPPMLKTELFVVAAVKVTLAPLAVKLPDELPLVPTTTLPRLKLVGETLSWAVATAVPVPESDIVSVELFASDVSVTVPDALPLLCGWNVTVKLMFCPEFNVSGALMPLS